MAKKGEVIKWLAKSVDPTPYLTTVPKIFKGHDISIKKQVNNLTRVTFKNIPFNIPDEEVIHLCKRYGEPLNNIDTKILIMVEYKV